MRNATGVNPLLLTFFSAPVVGADWIAGIDASLVSGTTISAIQIRTSALEPGLLVPPGELLIQGPLLGSAVVPSNGVFDGFVFPIPADLNLLGLEAHAQAFVRANGALRLGNAVRLLLGE